MKAGPATGQMRKLVRASELGRCGHLIKLKAALLGASTSTLAIFLGSK